jgi:hypothetical protein
VRSGEGWPERDRRISWSMFVAGDYIEYQYLTLYCTDDSQLCSYSVVVSLFLNLSTRPWISKIKAPRSSKRHIDSQHSEDVIFLESSCMRGKEDSQCGKCEVKGNACGLESRV